MDQQTPPPALTPEERIAQLEVFNQQTNAMMEQSNALMQQSITSLSVNMERLLALFEVQSTTAAAGTPPPVTVTPSAAMPNQLPQTVHIQPAPAIPEVPPGVLPAGPLNNPIPAVVDHPPIQPPEDDIQPQQNPAQVPVAPRGIPYHVILNNGNASSHGANSSPPPVLAENEQDKRLKTIEDKMKAMQGFDRFGGISYKDFCLFPDMTVPEKFKLPEFEKYDGTGHPIIHLRIYYAKMAQYRHHEKFVIQTFQESLKGAALVWFAGLNAQDIPTWDELCNRFVTQYQYNLDTAPTLMDLQGMEMKPGQSFRDYLLEFRNKANAVIPAVSEKVSVPIFINTLKGVHYTYMLSHVSSSFASLVSLGETIDMALRTGKLKDPLKESVVDSTRKTIFKKTVSNDGINAVYPTQPLHITLSAPPGPTQGEAQRRPSRQFTALPIPQAQLFKMLVEKGLLVGEAAFPEYKVNAKFQDPKAQCSYHLGFYGHSTDHCPKLKHKIQDLIDSKDLIFNPVSPPNVNTNPLPSHATSSSQT